MNRRIRVAFLLVLFCGLVFAQEHVTTIPGGDISNKRESRGLDLALDYFRKNGAGKSDTAITSILSEDFFSLNPGLVKEPRSEAKTPDECENAANQALQKALDAALPKYTDEKLKSLAEEKYGLYKIGERVHVNYSTNSQVPKSVDGIYYGTTSGLVKVGKFRIRLDDMANVEGNEIEIQRFSPDVTADLRRNYIQRLKYENAKKREEFIAEKRESVVKETIDHFTRSNEEAGYTCFDGAWLKPIDYLNAIVGKARNIYAEELMAIKKEKVDKALQTVQAQVVSQQDRIAITPDDKRINPTDVLEAQAEAERQKAEALAKKQAEEEARKREAEERAESQRLAAIARKEAAEREKQAALEAANASAEEVNESNTTMVIVGVIFILGIIGGIAFVVMKIKKKAEKDRFTKFFEGKGKVQKDFWDRAAADPENFKYVAYMFPSIKEATSALQKLTYITATPNGDLRCTRDNLLFGVYPHQDGAVAFIGGSDFHYAPWREATAVLPELEGARYFKVSTEPAVSLEVPDIDKMATEQNIKIESLGVEDYTDPEGGFTRCYKYKAESKEMAMLFLENFQVNEEGIVVQVETPEGIFGKDENGIYTA
ncbi:MAG: hypothetical protein IKP00_11260 [Victivallales bacterium]|nr:hypothetical protein [Victivallales bacterium]